MSSNNFTSTFFFRHLEVFVISGILILYFQKTIVNYLNGISVLALLLIVAFGMLIYFLFQTSISFGKNIKDKNLDMFSGIAYEENEDVHEKLDDIFNTITNEAFCPECGSIQKSYNTNFFCEDCEVKFVLEEEVE